MYCTVLYKAVILEEFLVELKNCVMFIYEMCENKFGGSLRQRAH